jgi:repressor of nif and glnA expression
MITRKAKLGKEIDNQILTVLKESENPISTRDLALKIDRAWYSVQTHCLKLQVKGKIKGFNVTNINVWEIKR